MADRLGGSTVISHGVGERAGAIDLLLHGFAEFAAGRPGARLVLLGTLEEAASGLADTIENLGIADAISTPGHLMETSIGGAGRADVAVQLRTSSDGEASGSVCDCLAARVPTIVASIGWLKELPDPVVLHVPRDCPPAALGEKIGPGDR